VLVAITLVLSILLFFVEHRAQPEQFRTIWDSLSWSFMGYIDNPSGFADFSPVTIVGRWIGVAVAVVKIMVFAVPAGLIANGFGNAIEEDRRKQELESFRARLHKSFRRVSNRSLRQYLNGLPDQGGEKLKKLNFVPESVPVVRVQVNQGMDLKDIIDTCREFPEFRLMNLASERSDEEDAQDRIVITHFPLNRPYGYCVDRGSKVTIVSPASVSEVGTGWFTYYLAKLGGFNYISKDIEVDPDEKDSFFNLYKRFESDPERMARRKLFFDDLSAMAAKPDSWIIVIADHIKDSSNQEDIHVVDTLKDPTVSSVQDTEAYFSFVDDLTSVMKEKLGLVTDLRSDRYPMLKTNVCFKLKGMLPSANSFIIRPSSELINFSTNRLLAAFLMAETISSHFDDCKGIADEDLKGFDTGIGY